MGSTESTLPSPFYDLNKDCFRLIAEYLDRPSLRNLSQTCQKFRNIIHCTSTLDTRLLLAEVSIWYRAEEYQIVVNLYRPNDVDCTRIHLTTKDNASNAPMMMSIDELPSTSSESISEESFYFGKNGKLHLSASIHIRSQEDVARFFNEMSRYVFVQNKFFLEHYYTAPKTLAWLTRSLVEAFPGSSQHHFLLDIQPTDLELAIRPIVEVWEPNIVMRFAFRPNSRSQLEGLGVGVVDKARVLTESAVRLMREMNRTADVVRKLRTEEPAEQTTVEVKLAEDKSTLNFEIS